MDSVSVQLITWNVATMFPDTDLSLRSLLGSSNPDFVLLGLQEVKSQPQNMLADSLLAGEDPWTACFRQSLAGLGYVKVKSIRLVGIILSMFSLAKHVPHIRGLETQYSRLGMGGFWGNKGCVSVRWSVYGVSVCVVNCHLAAHGHNNQLRLDSYNTILGTHVYSVKETEMILYHDYVFWMGDLNFRLETEETPQHVANSVSRQQFGTFLSCDQLSAARSNGSAFSELNETNPTFPPSYKYKIGTSEYDTKRHPAWTDRILFRANVANYDNYKLNINQHSYTALSDFTQSDHKPVSSNFSLSVFSPKIASDLLLSVYNPIVTFVEAGPYYVGEDLLVIYTIRTDDRRFVNSWDWIGLYRADSNNLEDYITYTWASDKLVRDAAFEVIFGETVNLSPGQYRLVYFSVGGKDILGYSSPFSVKLREYERADQAIEAREAEL